MSLKVKISVKGVNIFFKAGVGGGGGMGNNQKQCTRRNLLNLTPENIPILKT